MSYDVLNVVFLTSLPIADLPSVSCDTTIEFSFAYISGVLTSINHASVDDAGGVNVIIDPAGVMLS